jgi:hypothetical protein
VSNKKQTKQNPPQKTYVFVTVPVVVVLALGAVLFMRVLCVVVGGVRAVLTRVGMLFVVVRGMRAILTLVVMTVAVVMIVVLLKIIYLLYYIIKLVKYSVIYVNEIIRDPKLRPTHTHYTPHSPPLPLRPSRSGQHPSRGRSQRRESPKASTLGRLRAGSE